MQSGFILNLKKMTLKPSTQEPFIQIKLNWIGMLFV